jgi:hypothetical protein
MKYSFMVDKTPNAQGGKKFDKEKPRCYLLSAPFILETAEVLTFGGNRYGDNNWRNVERERYESALYRHWLAYMSGEKTDPETGKSHLAHINCCAQFLYEFDKIQDQSIFKTKDPSAVIQFPSITFTKVNKTPGIVSDLELISKWPEKKKKVKKRRG